MKKSGAGFPVATNTSPAAGSSEKGVQTAPPPVAASVAPQVSAPGSPGRGMVLKRQTGSPSFSLNAPTQPLMGTSLPAGPMMTRSSKMTGGIVKVSQRMGLKLLGPLRIFESFEP